MNRLLTTVFAGLILVGMSACSEYHADVAKSLKKKEPKVFKYHGDAMTIRDTASFKPNVEALKQNKLNNYPQKSIGDAFDAYNKVSAKEWQEAVGKDGKMYVDYIGWFEAKPFLTAVRQNGSVRTGLNVKFVIEKNGDTSITLASKVSVKNDGKVWSEVIPFPEITNVVDAIYNNRALDF